MKSIKSRPKSGGYQTSQSASIMKHLRINKIKRNAANPLQHSQLLDALSASHLSLNEMLELQDYGALHNDRYRRRNDDGSILRITSTNPFGVEAAKESIPTELN